MSELFFSSSTTRMDEMLVTNVSVLALWAPQDYFLWERVNGRYFPNSATHTKEIYMDTKHCKYDGKYNFGFGVNCPFKLCIEFTSPIAHCFILVYFTPCISSVRHISGTLLEAQYLCCILRKSFSSALNSKQVMRQKQLALAHCHGKLRRQD